MLIWYGAGAVAAIAIAWLAALVHASGHAPIGLISLVVGVALGAVLGKIAATQRVAGRKRLIIGTILLAIRRRLGRAHLALPRFPPTMARGAEKSPQVAIFRPESPWSPREFFLNEATPQRTAVWCIDALVIIASAVGTVVVLSRSPSPPASNPQPLHQWPSSEPASTSWNACGSRR